MVDHGKSTKRKKFHDKDKYYKRESPCPFLSMFFFSVSCLLMFF